MYCNRSEGFVFQYRMYEKVTVQLAELLHGRWSKQASGLLSDAETV